MRVQRILLQILILLFVCPLFGTENTEGDAKKFEYCDPQVLYRADEPVLASVGLSDLPIAKSRPDYIGTEKDLQAFFDEHVVLPPEAQDVFVRVIVAFVVNCKGEFGRFRSLGNAAPRSLVNPIIEACEMMPSWKPAKAGDQPVDCVTRLAFTINQGALKVRYW